MVEQIIQFLHLLATCIWIGGTIHMHFILNPTLKQLDAQQSARLQGAIAKRFSIVAWSCVVILLITGYLKTPPGMLFDTSSELGAILIMKHILVLAMIIIGLNIALGVVPRLQAAAPKPGEAPSTDFFKNQKRLGTLATTNMVLGILVVAGASMLW